MAGCTRHDDAPNLEVPRKKSVNIIRAAQVSTRLPDLIEQFELNRCFYLLLQPRGVDGPAISGLVYCSNSTIDLTMNPLRPRDDVCMVSASCRGLQLLDVCGLTS